MVKVKVQSIKQSIIIFKNKYNILVEEEGNDDNKNNVKNAMNKCKE